MQGFEQEMTMAPALVSERRVLGRDVDAGLRADVLVLAPALTSSSDELADAMTQRFMSAVAPYHALPARDEIVQDYRAHLDVVVQAPGLPVDQQVRVVRAVAAAHGRAGAGAEVPLAILLEFYRQGMPVLWDAVLQHRGRLEGAPGDEVTAAVSAVWNLQDVWVHSMAAAYYTESRVAIVARERHRSALVDALLDGRVRDSAELADTAEALRLPYDGRYVVVVAEVAGSGQQEKFHLVENRLTRAGIASAWRLLPDGQPTVAGIAALGRAGAQQILTETLSEAWEQRAGISPQFSSLGQAQRALRFAKLAMASAPRGTAQVTVFDQAPVAVVAASAPDVLAEVAQAVLGSLNQLPDEEREVLVGTVRTWLACGGSTEATAKALFCHPNTVRYRLNRVTEHTGRSLTDPQAVTELCLALHADLLARCA